MDINGRGRLEVAVLITFVVASVGVIALSGFVLADDEKTGEEVLTEIQDTYNTADSLSAETVVTVEGENGTEQFDVSVAATDDGQLRLNGSSGNQYFMLGTSDETAWAYESATGLSGVLTKTGEDTASATLRTGTAERRGAFNALPVEDVNLDDTVDELRSEIDEGELPAEWQDALDELPGNATLAEVAASDEVNEVLQNESRPRTETADAPAAVSLPEQWTEFNGSIEFNESKVEAALTEFDAGEVPEEWAEAEWPNSIEKVRTEVVAMVSDDNRSESNSTVKLVGTPTVDGEETHELLITSTEHDHETRLWAGVDSNEIHKLEQSSAEVTVTVDVLETRFDVSPADSTFAPPGTTEVTRINATTTDEASEFGTDASFEVAVPGDTWTFEHGTTVTTEMSISVNASFNTDGSTLLGSYTDGDQSLLVTQATAAHDEWNDTETSTVGDYEVVITETDEGIAGSWTNGETTTTVVGEFSESKLRSIIEAIRYEATVG
ncbi:hypothetical protein ACFQJ7_00765 [Halovenus rubra]|uniref:Uncharacterized protein n=2 Tax=Halovenus rubra TaxID=869890 RepID=A0ACC7E0Z1_9EURY|nr:hypothetical protein [Halovenus rubra]